MLPLQDKRDLYEHGYTHVRGAVPLALVHNALRAINAELARGISKEESENIVDGIAFRGLMDKPAITDLFNKSSLAPLVRELVGEIQPVTAGQIALRFPGAMCMDSETFRATPWWNRAWHIDGLTSKRFHHPGRIDAFTCLVGVMLSDQSEPMAGNLIVFPGAHRALAEHFAVHGLDEAKQKGDAALPKHLAFPSPYQVVGKPGDVVICNHMLPHSIAPNTSPHIRYSIYFRVHARRAVPVEVSMVTDLWAAWAGLQAVVKSAPVFWTCEACTLHNDAAASQCAACSRPRAAAAAAVVAAASNPATSAAPATPAPAAPVLSTMQRFASVFQGAGLAGASQPPPQSPPQLQAQRPAQSTGTAAGAKEVAQLEPEADALFEAHQWAQARDKYVRLCELRPEDFIFSFKAGVCLTVLEDMEPQRGHAARGEQFLRRSAALCATPQVFSLLGRNLLKQRRFDEALAHFGTMAACPESDLKDTWAQGEVKAAFVTAPGAFVRAGRGNEWLGFLNHIRATQPRFAALCDASFEQYEIADLWIQSECVMKTEPKSEVVWVSAQRIYTRLCVLNPSEGMLFVLAAFAFNHGPAASVATGEASARRACELLPTSPVALAVLAANLGRQGKKQQAAEAAERMLQHPFEHNKDHVYFMLDGFRAARDAMPAQQFAAFATRAAQQFPTLASELDAVRKESCVIQ